MPDDHDDSDKPDTSAKPSLEFSEEIKIWEKVADACAHLETVECTAAIGIRDTAVRFFEQVKKLRVALHETDLDALDLCGRGLLKMHEVMQREVSTLLRQLTLAATKVEQAHEIAEELGDEATAEALWTLYVDLTRPD
jgi:hypothetical protein